MQGGAPAPVDEQNLAKALAQLNANRNITVSARGRQLITLLLRAIKEDPLPTWGPAFSDQLHNRLAGSESLKTTFATVSILDDGMTQLGTFHLLRWVADNLYSFCPVRPER
jgi:hypothetical protein